MTRTAPSELEEQLLDELARASRQSQAAAEAAAVAAANAREGYDIGRALVRRARERRIALGRAALEHATGARPPAADVRAVALERSAAAAVAVARPGELLTFYVEEDEEGRPRLIQVPPGVSPEALRAMRREQEVA